MHVASCRKLQIAALLVSQREYAPLDVHIRQLVALSQPHEGVDQLRPTIMHITLAAHQTRQLRIQSHALCERLGWMHNQRWFGACATRRLTNLPELRIVY
jgi:hypothetical protein